MQCMIDLMERFVEWQTQTVPEAPRVQSNVPRPLRNQFQDFEARKDVNVDENGRSCMDAMDEMGKDCEKNCDANPVTIDDSDLLRFGSDVEDLEKAFIVCVNQRKDKEFKDPNLP